jgi:hypothetical protein
MSDAGKAPDTSVLTGGAPAAAPAAAAPAAAAPAAAAPAAGGPAAGDTAIPPSWFTNKDAGIDAAHHPYIQNKGWKSPADMLESYVSMEKVVGLERAGQADRILVKPKDLGPDAKPEEITAHQQATKEYWSKVGGVPKDAAGYDVKLPEAFKDNPVYQKASEIFLKSGLPAHFAQPMLDTFTAMNAEVDAGIQSAINAEEATLAKDPAFAANKEISRRAVQAAGITDAEASLIGAVLGPKRAHEAFVKLGAAFKEGATPGGNGGGGEGGSKGFSMTREQAAAKATEMRKDPQFQANYLSPNPAVRKVAIEQIEALDKMASGG